VALIVAVVAVVAPLAVADLDLDTRRLGVRRGGRDTERNSSQ